MPPTTTLPSSRRATTSSPRITPTARRRSAPWIALGVLLVLGCALAFGVISTRLGERQAVLAVARPVPAGQLVTATDLATVHVTVDPGLIPIPATARSSVIGRPAAVPLVPGAPLTPAQLGVPSTLAPDQAVVALALKAGRFPPGLSPGAHVLVADTGTDSQATAAATGSSTALEDNPLTSSATVVEVDRPSDDTEDTTVVSLRVPATGAARLAAAGAADRVALVLLPPSKS